MKNVYVVIEYEAGGDRESICGTYSTEIFANKRKSQVELQDKGFEYIDNVYVKKVVLDKNFK